jgi:hypothetical protein
VLERMVIATGYMLEGGSILSQAEVLKCIGLFAYLISIMLNLIFDLEGWILTKFSVFRLFENKKKNFKIAEKFMENIATLDRTLGSLKSYNVLMTSTNDIFSESD